MVGLPAYFVSGSSAVTISDDGLVHVVDQCGSSTVERFHRLGELEVHVEDVRAKIMAWHLEKLRRLQR